MEAPALLDELLPEEVPDFADDVVVFDAETGDTSPPTPLEESQTRTRLAIQQEKRDELQRQLERLGDSLAITDQEESQKIPARIGR